MNKEKERIIPHIFENVDFEKLREEHYKDEINNHNNFSYWYPKVKDCGIKMVKAWIFKFSFEEWKILESMEEEDCIILRMELSVISLMLMIVSVIITIFQESF